MVGGALVQRKAILKRTRQKHTMNQRDHMHLLAMGVFFSRHDVTAFQASDHHMVVSNMQIKLKTNNISTGTIAHATYNVSLLANTDS